MSTNDVVLKAIVEAERDYALSIANNFLASEYDQSAEMWQLVVARLNRVLEDYNSKVCVGGTK